MARRSRIFLAEKRRRGIFETGNGVTARSFVCAFSPSPLPTSRNRYSHLMRVNAALALVLGSSLFSAFASSSIPNAFCGKSLTAPISQMDSLSTDRRCLSLLASCRWIIPE